MILLISLIFILGYAAITLEHSIKLNKAASAMLTGVLCWTVYALFSTNTHHVNEHLTSHLGDVAGILFFLLGAMTIVELIDAHDGFQIIIDKIQTTNKSKLVWSIAFITFFLSAVLDNLTTSIVMVSLLRKLIDEKMERWMFAGLIIIAANAGGAWSPIGDVTTTMLWIGEQVTTWNIMIKTFIPSLVCMIIPTYFIARQMKGKLKKPVVTDVANSITSTRFERNIVFFFGVGMLLFVPVFKTITHLPPFMGILFGLSVLWIVTEIIHHEKDEAEKGVLSVNHALRKIDTPSVLFFLGILLSIAALEVTGILTDAATFMDNAVGNINIITMLIGVFSAIVDNVPLVAAAQGMYSMDIYPTDHNFWEFLAYCAGTGGSCLIIGSAAGVAAMGIEKINFFWYIKKISLLALVGYLAGAAVYLLQNQLF
ncbi:MAG: sodium:proton antiporter NhaD [Chitinophagaceae bacterium]|nr:sodium:proton antiporter NhaD [Chitinophagaceae bacterium]MBP7107928.1 sodium:proton antiporter NhaD [Chitinophagaceae bacterium]MBP7314054.1 sodium:proton antiporter NhaD [Chitinophagaceae bacterium]HQZ49602.1 sodium:proton antiporter NhaD [Chitinophagaceae bacterium]